MFHLKKVKNIENLFNSYHLLILMNKVSHIQNKMFFGNAEGTNKMNFTITPYPIKKITKSVFDPNTGHKVTWKPNEENIVRKIVAYVATL